MDNLIVKYDSVYYYGLDKTRLYFENLIINDIEYGNYVADVSSDLGSALHEYILSHETEIKSVSTGDDLPNNTLTLSVDDIIASVKDYISGFVDEIAKTHDYDNASACVSYYNSLNEKYKNEARRFSAWRDQAWETYNEFAEKAKNGILSQEELSSDYVMSKIPTMLWDEDEENLRKQQEQEQQKDAEENRSLESWKILKLEELQKISDAFENNVNKKMWFVSSVEGYYINGDRRTRSNIQDLIDFSESEPIVYRDYLNIERELTKDQLRIMLKEHILNGQNLYKQKWIMLEEINACTTIEEVKNIDILFKMTNFYADV